ncbi:MAG: hypothetical protein M1820_010579 [Bogoriella megaspora]|nr:MAG: hypothetical protein M1820_010579 [Bogoriella megaspora]
MFYSAYICEEIMQSRYTIAPGCTGTREGGRCNFNEFMKYIWAPFPEKGDTVRPDVKVIRQNTVFETAKLALIIQNMDSYKPVGMSKPITGKVDVSRIAPGSHDYYAAMRDCGTVMTRMRSFYDTMGDDNVNKATSKNLLARAKEAANMVVDQRAREMDNDDRYSRIKDLERRLNTQLPRKQGRDVTRQVGKYEVWDTTQTARTIIKDDPGMGVKIMKALNDWKNDPARDFGFEPETLDGVQISPNSRRQLWLLIVYDK